MQFCLDREKMEKKKGGGEKKRKLRKKITPGH